MWRELSADARLYSALRWPHGAGWLRRALIWWLSPGLLVLGVQRLSHRYRLQRQERGWTATTVGLRLLLALGFPLLVLRAKSHVAATTIIGPNVYLSDGGYLFLGPQRIGGGTLIHERVTIGVRAGEDAAPVIGANVWIGPDSVIYGAIALGDGVTVLPGSVLSMNVPPATVVGGNPAKIVRRDFDNSGLRRSLTHNVDQRMLAVP
jgi:serine acetyltransferase